MLKLLIAFILGIIFATAIITIVLTRHKVGTVFYDQSHFWLGFDSYEEYNKITKRKYILAKVQEFSIPQETDTTHSEVKE